MYLKQKRSLLPFLRLISILAFIGISFVNSISQNSISSDPKFEITRNRPNRITQLSKNHYLIDFGKAYFGTIELFSETTQSDSLIIHLGEKLGKNKLLDRNPGGTIRYQSVILKKLKAGHKELIQLVPDKRNTNQKAIQLPDSFGVIMPFRYCEIENLHIPIQDLQVVQKAFHYSFNDEASYFNSSDTILNQVWDLCKHTIKASTFAGYYVDGDRERIPYEADAYINQLSHYCVDSVYSIARRTNEYFIDHPTWPTEWLLHTVLLFYQDYMYTGDLSSIRENYEMLKLKTLQELAREDGLISSKSEKMDEDLKIRLGFKDGKANVSDIVDWPKARGENGGKWLPEHGERDGYDMVEINTVVNSFFYHNLIVMTKIAEALEKTSDAAHFKEKSKKVKEAINTKLFDSGKGIYLDGEGSEHSSLHANMFPLAFGLVPDEHIKTVANFIKSRGMACSVYGAQYLLEGLFIANKPEYALQLITDTTHDRTWWHMIESGSTMTWEAWDIKYKSNLDWNHAWGTAPLNIITRHLWGITPSTPGFQSINIKPQMADLTFSEIKVPTIRGCITGNYFLAKNGLATYKIKIPDGITGEFHLPDNNEIILNEGMNEIIVPIDSN